MIYLWLYSGLLLIYSGFSYLFVDPNLVLSSRPWFWQLQLWLWQLAATQRTLVSVGYLLLVVGLFGSYGLMIRHMVRQKDKNRHFWRWLLIPIMTLFLAYPALSHDIFNYLFNAKMVLIYHANPHVKVALDYASDPWTQFMHNTHTPAPYGYGFTLISLLPSFLGGGHLKITIILFRLMMAGALLLTAWLMRQMPGRVKDRELLLILTNPLLLIETIGNIHNDILMMGLLFISFWAMWRFMRQGGKKWLWLSGFAWLGSVSIKLVTVLVPVAVGIWVLGAIFKKKVSWGMLLAIGFYIPLLTDRSQHFLPWYLIWSLMMLVWPVSRMWKGFFVGSTVLGLLSYVPFMNVGQYTDQVLLMRAVILYVPAAVWLVSYAGLTYGVGLKQNLTRVSLLD